MTDTPTRPSVAIPVLIPRVLIRRKSGSATDDKHKNKMYFLPRKLCTHPWMNREDPSDAYELPASEREDWWRSEVKVTPVPGSYEESDFIQELNKRPNTYNFKAQSRDKCKDKNPNLAPGGYEYEDFIDILSKKPATYSFKTGQRFARDVLNFGLKDKDINVAPNAYSTQKYLAIDDEKLPVKNYMFRSQTKRFSYTIGHKDFPSPASYKVKDPNAIVPAITSCFRSKTPRYPEKPKPLTIKPL